MSQDKAKLAEFVELSAPGLKARLICSYAQRAYEGGLTLAIHVPDEREARELDEALWTFAQDAFIPHVRLEEAREPLIEPVVLFSGEPGELNMDVLLLSVDGDLPGWFARFPHVRDFAVLYDDALRQAGRRRYAACKAAGYRMSMVKPGA